MKRFIEGVDRAQSTLFPERLEDWVEEDNPVRVIDIFVDELDLGGLGFGRAAPEATGRPGYHPSVLLKLYIYGYLNRVQSSRRLEREAGRNVEVMWLTGRLVPDHKTIADFRKGLKDQELIRGINSPENGGGDQKGLRSVCCALSSAWITCHGERGDRRLQVQGGEQPGPQLHGGQDEASHGSDRGERGTLSASARQRRPTGAVACTDHEDSPPDGQDRKAQGRDVALGSA
jgi:transposase